MNGWIKTVSGGGWVDVPVLFFPAGKKISSTRCAFCDCTFYSPVQEAADAEVQRHIQECEEHPLYKARQDLLAADAEIAELRAKLKAKPKGKRNE